MKFLADEVPDLCEESLEQRIARLCGHLNAVHVQLVDAITEALETNAWHGWGGQNRFSVGRLANRLVAIPSSFHRAHCRTTLRASRHVQRVRQRRSGRRSQICSLGVRPATCRPCPPHHCHPTHKSRQSLHLRAGSRTSSGCANESHRFRPPSPTNMADATSPPSAAPPKGRPLATRFKKRTTIFSTTATPRPPGSTPSHSSANDHWPLARALAAPTDSAGRAAGAAAALRTCQRRTAQHALDHVHAFFYGSGCFLKNAHASSMASMFRVL